MAVYKTRWFDRWARKHDLSTRALCEAVHETAKGLHAAGVMKQVTLREFDRLCLPPVEPLSPGKIRKIRVQSDRKSVV